MASMTLRSQATPARKQSKSISSAQSSPTSQGLPGNRKRKVDQAVSPKAAHTSNDTNSTPVSPSTTKRKRIMSDSTPTLSGKAKVIDLTADVGTEVGDTEATTPSKKTKPKAKRAADEEKRPRSFRSRAPQAYLEKLHRATTQRMFVIDRTRGGTEELPEETIDIAGTTGNIYSVRIAKQPTCTCPDSQKGNQCKHIIYVLHKVLKAPDHLQYQLAFISSELREIFQNAPASPKDKAKSDEDHPGKRKPVDGDCPICFTEFESDTEEIVWCKAACGNNIHKTCFEQWAASQKGNTVKCVYCRTPWQGDEDSIKRISKQGKVNEEGYVNVASELGLSGMRDYSTYHQPWVRGRFGYY